MMGFLKKLHHLVKASGNKTKWTCILLHWDPGALSYKYDDVPHPQWRLRTCRKPNKLSFLFLCCCLMRSHLSSGRARWVLLRWCFLGSNFILFSSCWRLQGSDLRFSDPPRVCRESRNLIHLHPSRHPLCLSASLPSLEWSSQSST